MKKKEDNEKINIKSMLLNIKEILGYRLKIHLRTFTLRS